MVQKRIIWIDYAKAFAIAFVVFGHISSRNVWTDWVYSFHMPLFFFLSGLTLKPQLENIYKPLFRLFKRIMIPYFLYSGLYLLYNILQNVCLHKHLPIFLNFIGIFLQIRGTNYTVGLWFLPLIFLAEMFIYFVITKKKWIQYMLISIAALLGFTYAQTIGRALPWGLDAVPIAAFFIYMGYECKPIKNIEIRSSGHPADFRTYTYVIVALFLNFILGRGNVALSGANVDMHKLMYGNPILFIVAAIFGIIFILLVCQTLPYNIGILSLIGQQTLSIYCMHGLILSFLKKTFEVVVHQNIEDVCVGLQLVASIAVIMVCVTITRLENRLQKRRLK